MPITKPSENRPEYHSWYSRERWRAKAHLQLQRHPLCVMCEARGIVTAANVADHVTPHKGDQNLFWFGQLQSLCDFHHNSDKKLIETRGYTLEIGLDGYPTDSRHPYYRQG